jgi:hypothetical protein
MNIECFDDLLAASRAQTTPQRLLLVFAQSELPDDATPAQRERFRNGQGGALVPVMCVDKTPQELRDFAQLALDSKQFGKDWSMVFVSAMSDVIGLPPGSDAAGKPLQRMVESIQAGALANMIPFDRQGQAVNLS